MRSSMERLPLRSTLASTIKANLAAPRSFLIGVGGGESLRVVHSSGIEWAIFLHLEQTCVNSATTSESDLQYQNISLRSSGGSVAIFDESGWIGGIL